MTIVYNFMSCVMDNFSKIFANNFTVLNIKECLSLVCNFQILFNKYFIHDSSQPLVEKNIKMFLIDIGLYSENNVAKLSSLLQTSKVRMSNKFSITLLFINLVGDIDNNIDNIDNIDNIGNNSRIVKMSDINSFISQEDEINISLSNINKNIDENINIMSNENINGKMDNEINNESFVQKLLILIYENSIDCKTSINRKKLSIQMYDILLPLIYTIRFFNTYMNGGIISSIFDNIYYAKSKTEFKYFISKSLNIIYHQGIELFLIKLNDCVLQKIINWIVVETKINILNHQKTFEELYFISNNY